MLSRIQKHLLFFSLTIFLSNAYANLPYYPITFPRDDAAHNNNVPYESNQLTEWWYYNGKLITTTGRTFGYFISIFNMHHQFCDKKNKPQSILMLQLSDIDNQKVYSTEIRYLDKNVSFDPYQLSIQLSNHFALNAVSSSYILDGTFNLNHGSSLKLSLTLIPSKLPLLVNQIGLIDMWNNKNSYYYSNTRLITSGYLQLDEADYNIDSQKSVSWMDHQWGDFILNPLTAKWLWSSIMLENGMDISVYEILNTEGKQINFQYANIIFPDNTRLYTSNFTLTPRKSSQSKYPEIYDISIPEFQLNLTLQSMVPNQDSFHFWEGIHDVKGFIKNEPISGFAYVENTLSHPKFMI